MTINFQPLLLRPRVAATRLGISIEALRNEVASGKLKQVRVGRMLYLRPEDLVDYVERLATEAANLRNARYEGKRGKRRGRDTGETYSGLKIAAEILARGRKRQEPAPYSLGRVTADILGKPKAEKKPKP